jgi:hypothetical protein
VICHVGETVYRGRVVTVEESVDPRALWRAIREGEATDRGTDIAVQARTPGPVHERVGCLHPEMGLHVRTALAEAARSRGYTTALDERIDMLGQRLAELSVEGVETTDQRRAVAEASADTERLQETVAERRGELQTRREEGDAGGTAEQFRATARELSEAETAAIAARQTLDQRRQAARDARDGLNRRMGLEDDLANARREARRRLVERTRDLFSRAVRSVPGGPGTVTDPFAVDALTAGLAVARIVDLAAPVVLACERFDSPRAASAWLDAPVVADV